MRLLVSVRNAVEAAAALGGGADIIDAKEPASGPLGPVEPHVLRAIAAAVGGAAPVSAALGDADSDDVLARVQAAVAAGVTVVKLGVAEMADPDRLVHRAGGLVESAKPAAMILVAYADHIDAKAPPPDEVVRAAHRTGAAGILLDTYNKSGAGLSALMTPDDLRRFVALAKAQPCVVTLAGRLTVDDIPIARSAGADIVGIRGAACDGGRSGTVTKARVAMVRERVAQDEAASSLKRATTSPAATHSLFTSDRSVRAK